MAMIKKKVMGKPMKKADQGTVMGKKKDPAEEFTQYLNRKPANPDSKILPKPGKQTTGDFMPKSYDRRFKPVKGGGDNYNGSAVKKYGGKITKKKK